MRFNPYLTRAMMAVISISRDPGVRSLLERAGIFDGLAKMFRRGMRIILAHSGFQWELRAEGVDFRICDPEMEYVFFALSGQGYEPAVTSHMKTTLGKGKICFADIGAFEGFYTAYVGCLNRNAEVHAFEPNSRFFASTEQSARINNINARLYRVALSDGAGQIRFFGRSMKVKGNRGEIVEALTFDELAEREGIRPDVVKIDVHGAEGKVLFGMRKALHTYIRHIYCELHPSSLLVDYEIGDILDLLIETGFEVYEMERFRMNSEAGLIRVEEAMYMNLIDESKWTAEQVQQRRMIFATKGLDHPETPESSWTMRQT